MKEKYYKMLKDPRWFKRREEILNRMQHPVVKELEKRGVGENKIKEHEHFYRKNLANKKEFK